MADNILLNGTPLPDARLELWGRRRRTEVRLGNLELELVFCVNCGTEGGAVTKGSPVFFLCDECVTKWGPPADMLEIPEEWARNGRLD